jgi:peptidyl-prolyl cis-trans isomerase SurA
MHWCKRFSNLILLVVCWGMGLGLVSAEIYNRVVAVVNDDVITLHELNSKLKEITGFEPAELQNRDMKKFEESRNSVLSLLIDEKITIAKIAELQIKVTDDEVNAAIEKLKKDNLLTQEELAAGLKERGISYEKYKNLVKRDLELIRLISYEVKSKIIIRDEKIKDHYEQNRGEFTRDGRVHLAAIFLKRKDPSDEKELQKLLGEAEEILSRLRGGESFEDLAKRYSQGPGAQEGGDLGFFKSSQLDPELSSHIAALSPGEVSRPMIRSAGVQIVKLLERQESAPKPLEEAREAIYARLYQAEVHKRYESWLRELRERAFIKIIN